MNPARARQPWLGVEPASSLAEPTETKNPKFTARVMPPARSCPSAGTHSSHRVAIGHRALVRTERAAIIRERSDTGACVRPERAAVIRQRSDTGAPRTNRTRSSPLASVERLLCRPGTPRRTGMHLTARPSRPWRRKPDTSDDPSTASPAPCNSDLRYCDGVDTRLEKSGNQDAVFRAGRRRGRE
jgi:hypothetical protein